MYIQLLSLLTFMMLSFGACKNHKESTKTPESATEKTGSTAAAAIDSPAVKPVVTDSLAPDTYRLTVVFFSIGMGTDGPSLLRFEESIGTYSAEIGKNIDYERANWGREGETDFCLRLNELSSAQQAEFVARTKELLKSAKWVNIYENKPCQHKRPR
ncbi:MAG TPA: hypothetical protein PLU53_13005 [Bacteroidia bacterium]|nr:hypothetical protein [Bacteroidia bacterium]